MPPSRRSSGSSRSRSRSSSSRRSSSSSSSRRRNGVSHSSSSSVSGFSTAHRHFQNRPQHVLKSMRHTSRYIHATDNDYIYFPEAWNYKNKSYKKGYYDNTGNYYSADELVFKKNDGSYMAHFRCDYCQSEAEINWKEGYQPTCKNCGAQMQKDDVRMENAISVQDYNSFQLKDGSKKILAIVAALVFIQIGPMVLMMFVSFFVFIFSSFQNNSDWESTQSVIEQETNLQIFGDVIYLDEVTDNSYVICSKEDVYEKMLTWDYGANSYYDYDSDCYLWYNTDVSPNVWQYWYDDIAGDDFYGWMEYCDGNWFIEVSDTEWEEYLGDTSNLWCIVD